MSTNGKKAAKLSITNKALDIFIGICEEIAASQLIPDEVHRAEQRIESELVDRGYDLESTFLAEHNETDYKHCNLLVMAMARDNLNVFQALLNIGVDKGLMFGTEEAEHHPIVAYFKIEMGGQKELFKYLLSLYDKEDLESLSGQWSEDEEYENEHVITFASPFGEHDWEIQQMITHFGFAPESLEELADAYDDDVMEAFQRNLDAMAAQADKVSGAVTGHLDLSEMVGMDDVKLRLEEICASFRSAKKHGIRVGAPKLVFLGSPGTGKSVGAKAVAKALKAAGVIRSKEPVFVTGASLKAQWVGHTSAELNKLFDRVEDSGALLVIDEFYSLFPEGDKKSEFVSDAVGVLLDRIERLRTGSALVVCGYPDDMERALQQNPGFESRFSQYVYFPDYSPTESLAILGKMLEFYKLKMNDSDAIFEFVSSLCRKNSYANARTMRNLAAHVHQKVANRSENGGEYEMIDSDVLSFDGGGASVFDAIRARKKNEGEKKALEKIHAGLTGGASPRQPCHQKVEGTEKKKVTSKVKGPLSLVASSTSESGVDGAPSSPTFGEEA